jgi:serine/threonine-protein kinase
MTAPEGTPDTAIDALRVALGSQYEVVRRVGIGGMGSVYLARDLTLDREVAVKVINPEVASNAALRERFLQEARTVAKLRHPGIVSVYAAGETDGMLYFVMEYVPGESLRDLLTRVGKLDTELGARVVREVALALDHASTLGLVHRDVKPENILIDGTSGRAMLTDFGVARAFEKEGGMTQTGMILGSPRYMSPEQASGDRVIDGRSDLYALALVGYEVFTGAPVVQANSAAAMLVKHLTETPAPLIEKVVDLPPHVAQAIDRGLAKDPDERWQSGREFAAAIAGGELTPTGERMGATMAGMRGAKAPAKKKPPVAMIGAFVAIFASLFTIFMSTGNSRKQDDLSSYIVAPFEIQSGDQSVSWLREGSVNMLTLALSQWTDLRVVDYERTLSLLDDEELGSKPRLSLDDALALARRASVGVVVTGQVQTTGDSLRVIAKLYNVRTGDAMEQAQEGGALTDDPRPVFDRLARQLLSIKGGPNSTMELTAVTTTSITAYRAYLDGVRFLNTWRLREADSAFNVAITADSTFALAHHKRSLTLGWSEAGGETYQSAAERAFALSARLPARERALVEGHYHLVQGMSAGSAGRAAESMVSFNKAIAL